MTDFSLPTAADLIYTDLLTVFCWVAQVRNFSRTADRLNTSAPLLRER